MSNEIGIYRGSFDPPHYEHLEAIDLALKSGMTSVTVIYKDHHPNKPFRSQNKVREQFLKILIGDNPKVFLTRRSYRATLADMINDPTVTRVYQIIGSDILQARVRPEKNPEKLAYFIHLRSDYPISSPLTTWNQLPAKISYSDTSSKQECSSSLIRAHLFEQNFDAVSPLMPQALFEHIVASKIYSPTEAEYLCKAFITEVKKIVEKEIGSKKLFSLESYPLSFHLGQDLGVSGLSGDIISFVKDKRGESVLAVKIFVGNGFIERYDSEMLGYDTLGKLHLTLVKTPAILFSHQKEEFALIGMSFVKGRSFAEVINSEPAAIDLCARANLELHLAHRTPPVQITPDHIKPYEMVIDAVIHSLDSLPGEDLAEEMKGRLRDRWIELRDRLLAYPISLSFTHGDPNHTNWIIDDELQQVTYIDLSQFKRSVSSESTPAGFAICELEESLLTIWMAAKRLGNIPTDRIRGIQREYQQRYFAYAPSDITTGAAHAYFTFYWSSRVVESLYSKIKSASSPESKVKYLAQLKDKITSIIEH